MCLRRLGSDEHDHLGPYAFSAQNDDRAVQGQKNSVELPDPDGCQALPVGAEPRKEEGPLI